MYLILQILMNVLDALMIVGLILTALILMEVLSVCVELGLRKSVEQKSVEVCKYTKI